MKEYKLAEVGEGKNLVCHPDENGYYHGVYGEILIDSEEDLKHLEDALKRKKEYEWHDLRKNPNDLPELYEPVLLKTLKSGYCVAYVDKDYDWYVDCHDEFNFCEKGSVYAVAWRYIEPFEEDEE